MTKEELSEKLNGRPYSNEISKDEGIIAKENGLVVVFGASDDLMEFRGAIDDEVDCWDGGPAYLDENGILEIECDNIDCPYFSRLKESAKKIEAVWHDDGIISWTYKTDIPHSTFFIIQDGKEYCEGIVFSINDLK